MGRFCPLYVLRSDGLLETTAKHGGRLQKEANKPTEKQLNSQVNKDGVRDYYREVAIDDTKHLDWRRKLGSMLARELGLDPNKSYILAAFPENFHLFEHVKTSKKGEGDVPKTKTHAGGGNDRQDAYLYGHPLGRKKRYRSPGDFFHHLRWLVTDEEGDSDNCGCKVCSPEELHAFLKEKEKDQKVESIFKDPGNSKPAAPVGRPSSQGKPPAASNPVQPSPAVSTQAHTVPSLAARPAATAQPPSQNLTLPLDANIDGRYGLFLFRQGELIWYDRSGAWGLGVVTERWKLQAQSHYKVQPLSCPGHETKSVVVPKDTGLRPWLAWSVPPLTHSSLRDATVALYFDKFDFAGLAAGKYGAGDVEIDASILAAKAIDASYTTFAPVSRSEPQPGMLEMRWGGMYLGGEKIWLSDPLRLYANQEQATTRVVVLRQIVERTQRPAFNTQAWSSITLVGDVYTLEVAKYTNVQVPIIPGTDYPGLPPRMLEDVRRRNAYTIPATSDAHYWKPFATSATFQLKDIRGRWYESMLMLPILVPDFESNLRQGSIPEVTGMMNGCGDCNMKNGVLQMPAQRKQTREQAFGKAVPARTVIVDGADGPSQQQQQQQQQQVPQQTQQTQQHALGMGSNAAASMDEFMDLDGLSGANGMNGFGQGYL